MGLRKNTLGGVWLWKGQAERQRDLDEAVVNSSGDRWVPVVLSNPVRHLEDGSKAGRSGVAGLDLERC